MTNRGFALFIFVVLAGSGAVFAQSKSDVEQLYGQGVHLFHSNQLFEAIGCFDDAEALETQDPRIFFYRGLSHSRLGDEMMAAFDYEKASRMEQTVAGRSYSVPKALERIQGRERSVIERYRRAAKRAWEAEQNQRRQEEFQEQKTQNMQFYQGIINAGDSAASNVTANVEADSSPLLFGAQPIQPFGGTTVVRPVRKSVTSGGLTDDNIFKADVERVTVFEEPEPEVRRPTRQQDPSETGVFDFPEEDGDSEDSFDSSVLLQGAGSGQRSGGGFPINIFGGGGSGDDDFGDDFSTTDPFGGDDDSDGFPGSFVEGDESGFSMQGGMTWNESETLTNVNSTKESGRSFGKAFAGIFKKSGGTSSADKVSAPTEPTAPEPALDDDFDDNSDDHSENEFNPFDEEAEVDEEFDPFSDDF